MDNCVVVSEEMPEEVYRWVIQHFIHPGDFVIVNGLDGIL